MQAFPFCYPAEADTMFGYMLDGNSAVMYMEAQAAHAISYSGSELKAQAIGDTQWFVTAPSCTTATTPAIKGE